MKIVNRAPLLFSLGIRIAKAHLRGGHFLLRVGARAGLLDVLVRHQIGRVTFGVPISRLPWDQRDLENYEFKTIDCLCKAIAGYQDVTLFDCGADVGAFASLMCSKSDRLAKVIAFEPNSDALEILRWNMSQLPIRSQVIAKAVSCFDGRGRLESPVNDPGDVARFLAPGDGPIEVTTVDGCGVRGGDIAIKIDVEGGELEVLQGAKETIAAARDCAITLEAHPEVVARTGRDPVECLRFIESIRPFSFIVAETGKPVTTLGPILRKGQVEVWNVIGRSVER